MEKENVELIDDEVITLYDNDNNPVEFYEIACVELDDKYYAITQPVQPMEGVADDEALIFELQEQDDDTDLFVPLEDEELAERVFDEYMRAVADYESGCSCGCEDCDEEEHHHHECHDEHCDCKKKKD